MMIEDDVLVRGRAVGFASNLSSPDRMLPYHPFYVVGEQTLRIENIFRHPDLSAIVKPASIADLPPRYLIKPESFRNP